MTATPKVGLRRWRLTGASVLLLVGFCIAVCAPAAAELPRKNGDRPTPAEIEFFEKSVRPLLVRNCHKCHGPKKQEGGLRLDSRAAALKGGETGPVIVPGRPAESELIAAINYGADSFQMPPTGKLSDEQIAVLTRWVQSGTPWPEQTHRPSAAAADDSFDLAVRAEHWSFQPLQPRLPPQIERRDWPRTPVDNFILVRLEQAGLEPAPPADQRTLLRRVTYDLIGLPPTANEIESFLNDDSPHAFARVVDRLLASPQYGERWGRHWLDLVRYAETSGHEFDFDIPHAWVYRDYVIRALNENVPYDEFVVEHLAGDLLDPPRRDASGVNESIKGTAFYWFGQGKHSPVDVRAEECDVIDNQLDVLGKTFLGMTIACARCHDHKFDPIRSADYYALAGYLQSSRQQWAIVDPPEPTARIAGQLAHLKSTHRQAMADVAASRLERAVACLAESLLAARELGATGSAESESAESDPRSGGTGGLPASVNERQRQVPANKPTRATQPESPGAASASQNTADGPALNVWRIREYFSKIAANNPHDLFHPWTVLQDERDPAMFDSQRLELLDRLLGPAAKVSVDASTTELFDDFSSDSYESWFVQGPAFDTCPSGVVDFVVSPSSDRPVRSLVPPGTAHSGLLCGRLEGTIQSETFPIEKRYIHYRVRRVGGRADPGRQNKNGQISLIVDGFQLIRNPLYGNLTLNVEQDHRFAWYRQDLNKFIGSNAYIEIIDDDDGSLVIDKILFSDDPTPPAEPPNRLVVELLADTSIVSPETLAEGYQRLLERTLAVWRSGGLAESSDSADHIELINWMLSHDLFAQRLGTENSPGTNDTTRQSVAAAIEQYRILEADLRPPQRVIGMADGTGENEHLLVRGNHKKPGPQVPRRFLEVFAGVDQPLPDRVSGRLELTRKMVDPSNPLISRVIVNRVWQHHFGVGIVSTPDNFGHMGQPPTHPQLLDYLAGELIRSGWSLKSLHRLILTSSAYQMSSRRQRPERPLVCGCQPPALQPPFRRTDARTEEIDPANRLLHRARLHRLEGEIIRDAILSLSGRLNQKMTGPSVPPYLTEFMEGRGRPEKTGPIDGDGRRSVYISVRRNFLTPMFLAFDYPTPLTTIGRRSVSNVPAQALTMMNNPLVREQSRAWAERVLAEPHATPQARISRLYEMAFTRLPTEAELSSAFDFVSRHSGSSDETNEVDVWADLCHVLLNVKEFIYVN